MKVDIPEPVVYMLAGAIVDGVVTNIFTSSISNMLVDTLNYFSEKQRLMENEARIVVDVMGDTIEGVEFINGKIKNNIISEGE